MRLPRGIQVFERGWLSANNILFTDGDRSALVDSGYCIHSPQTLALIGNALGGRSLDLLVNTHLHSDHCGGNAALQVRYPGLITLIPPGQAAYVRDWDPVALSYVPTGQECPPFRIEGTVEPGTVISLGGLDWQVHAAPGHDPDSIVLFEPASRILVSADALWRNGFGVVFQELEGHGAFDDVARTLDVIERLRPVLVIPGHGPAFEDVAEALAAARQRLSAYVRDPRKHAAHGAKVLLKFKLLELRQVHNAAFMTWLLHTPYIRMVHERYFREETVEVWLDGLLADLIHGGAAARSGEFVLNR